MRFLSVLFFALVSLAELSARERYTINEAWRFAQGSPYGAFLPAADDSAWPTVDVPHTWNAQDADDDEPGFYRGPAWYRKRFFLSGDAVSGQVYLCFEGVNQTACVYVNGHFAGRHAGGYTRFAVDITPFVSAGENLVAVEADNRQGR